MSIYVLFKDVYLIDYNANSITRKPITDEFNDYVTKLANEISSNINLQYFKIRDISTQVISLVLDSIQRLVSGNAIENIADNVKSIANRLLEKEVKKQEQIAHMGINVKKGSLLQAILKNEDSVNNENEYLYVLTKVEHNDFIDEESYNIKRGFPVDKINLWKSCMIHIAVDEHQKVCICDIKIFLDNPATYWHDDFLEVDTIRKDDQNTKKLFRAVQRVLQKKVFNESNHDYFMLRNGLITYMRRTNLLDYSELIDTVFTKYQCEELSDSTKESLISSLMKLPESHGFDRQFNCVHTAIGARITKKTYDLSEDIELVIKRDIVNAENIISAGDENGKKFVKIYTDNKEVYNTFKPITRISM